jgi:integrase
MEHAVALDERTSEHYRRAILLLAFTGMRPAELCGLRVGDVDLVPSTGGSLAAPRRADTVPMADVVIDTDVASHLQKGSEPAWVRDHVLGARTWLGSARGAGCGTFTAVYGAAGLVASAAIGALYKCSVDAAAFTVSIKALAMMAFLPLLPRTPDPSG